jgi:hypothetical protein
MQKQIQSTTTKVDLSEVQKKVQAAEDIQVPTERIAHVKYRSCCGCGCTWHSIKLQVPYDSAIKDGDRLQASDINWDKVVR